MDPESVPAPPSAGPLLELSGVSKRWGPHRPAVLDELDLRVDRGSSVAIAGPNGAGKTTLLRIIAGLIRPDAGRIRLLDLDVARDRRRYLGRLGFLPAGNSGLYARLNVEQNLAFWARIALLPRSHARAAVADALEMFDLGELRLQRVDRLSMGQRQRVRLGMALLHRPDLILLDEPCTSLDESGAGLVRRALATVTARGAAAIVCAPGSERERLGLQRDCRLFDGRLQEAS